MATRRLIRVGASSAVTSDGSQGLLPRTVLRGSRSAGVLRVPSLISPPGIAPRTRRGYVVAAAEARGLLGDHRGITTQFLAKRERTVFGLVLDPRDRTGKPDVVGWTKDRIAYVESKSASDRLKPAQIAWYKAAYAACVRVGDIAIVEWRPK